MGLGDIPIEAISKQKVSRPLRKPSFHHGKPINAFDTETTQEGRIYLLSYVYDKEGFGPAFIGNSDFSPLSGKEIFNILTKNLTRSPSVNVWANLDFDANALFGTVLNKNQMIELADTNFTTVEIENIEYEITYIKGKFLVIKDSNGHKCTHYDILQFFGTSLANAAESWLDIDKLGLDAGNLDQYSWREITKYAMRDAEVTQELWKKFIDLGENTLGIPLGTPISTGFVAQHVVFDVLSEKPKWGSSLFQDLAAKSYHGGRFEVYRRGYFNDVIGLDINSAYPHHMSQMPDLDTCNVQVIGANIEDLFNADWGFVTATVSTDPFRNIQPFLLEPDSYNQKLAPALENYTLTCTIDEFLFAYENDYLLDYDIHKAGLVYENSNTVRPFSFLEEWYDDRLQHKKQIKNKGDKHDKFQFILKVIMNSVYGKTCQVTEKEEYLDDFENFTADTHEFVTEGYEGKPIKGWYEGGALFNPFYASYITALTRLQLHEAALHLGVEEDTIMFATDCLMIESDAVSMNKVEDMLNPEELGKWDYDYRGSAYVVGSGVYDVMDENNELVKMASRGFKEVAKNYDSWREASAIAEDTIVLENERPAKFKEWLLHDAHPRPSEFFKDERKLSPNFDAKRNWEVEATFDNLLSDNHSSNALEVAD